MKWTLSIIYPILITQLSLPARWARLLGCADGPDEVCIEGTRSGNLAVEECGRWRRRMRQFNGRASRAASSGEAQSLAKDRPKEGDVELAGAVGSRREAMWQEVAWSSALSRRKPWAASSVKKIRARGPLEMDRKRGSRVVSCRGRAAGGGTRVPSR